MSIKLKEKNIKNCIYTIRDQQVMLDADLAEIYGYEVKVLNQQVKRNINRFPEDFMFKLTLEEMKSLPRSQFLTLEGKGKNLKYAAYAFTEQGINMLSAVLKSDLAIYQSIMIMRTFKEMRNYIAMNNEFVTQRDQQILKMEMNNEITGIKENVAKLENSLSEVMNNFIPNVPLKQFTILNSQKFEASEAIENIIKQAKHSIIVIDDYPDSGTLSLLRSKRVGVSVTLITDNKAKKLTLKHVKEFISQYGNLSIKRNGIAHDRYIILDKDTDSEIIYHLGQSLKDAGNKLGTINLIRDISIYSSIIDKMLQQEELELS